MNCVLLLHVHPDSLGLICPHKCTLSPLFWRESIYTEHTSWIPPFIVAQSRSKRLEKGEHARAGPLLLNPPCRRAGKLTFCWRPCDGAGETALGGTDGGGRTDAISSANETNQHGKEEAADCNYLLVFLGERSSFFKDTRHVSTWASDSLTQENLFYSATLSFCHCSSTDLHQRDDLCNDVISHVYHRKRFLFFFWTIKKMVLPHFTITSSICCLSAVVLALSLIINQNGNGMTNLVFSQKKRIHESLQLSHHFTYDWGVSSVPFSVYRIVSCHTFHKNKVNLNKTFYFALLLSHNFVLCNFWCIWSHSLMYLSMR